jgi:hypothetical protein
MIVTIAEIQRRARAAYAAGLPLEDCPLPWHSNARATWEAEYQQLGLLASSGCHIAPAGRRHFDGEQT